MNERERQEVMLGALLHDIGKFRSRAKGEVADADITAYRKNLDAGQYAHALFSGWMIDKAFSGSSWTAIERLALEHHSSVNDRANRIIRLADWLSSGERKPSVEQSGKIESEPMESIFTMLKKSEGEPKYLPVSPISDDHRKHIPCNAKAEAFSEQTFDDIYHGLLDEMSSQRGRWPVSFEKTFLRAYSLLMKYGIAVPSASYKDYAQVSLFHHSAMTAAIAGCLAASDEISDEIIEDVMHFLNTRMNGGGCSDSVLSHVARPDFLMVRAEVAGIQQFIYSSSSKGALKQISAKSFYVGLLNDAFARRVIKEFGLSEANRIFVGGGNTVLLVPNTHDAATKIDAIRKECNAELKKRFGGLIYCAVATVAFDYEYFLCAGTKDFSLLWERLAAATREQKSRRFWETLTIDDFIPAAMTSCEFCGAEKNTRNEECRQCDVFESLARELRTAKYLSIDEAKAERLTDIFGVSYMLHDDAPPSESAALVKSRVRGQASTHLLFLRNNADGFFFESAGDPAERTFEDIADASKTEFKRWGVLRADVDDLGAVFSAGLSKPSLSRVSMLSFAFDHFFKGCVSTIVERMAPVAFVAYAGGDDLFIIAPWDDLVPLAQGLRNAFSDYVGSDKTVTFTAGAVIAPSKKYPISRLADAAEAEEKNGKSLPGKDALSFLDSVAHWADFKKIVADKDSLISAIGDSGRGNVPASRALLRQIIETHEEGSLQSIWRLMYQLARYADRMWRPPQRGERLMRLRELVVEQHELKPYIKCAARWAELTTRKER